MLCGMSDGSCAGYCGDRPGLCGLYRVTWSDPSDLVAVLTWDKTEARGVLWSNRRLVGQGVTDRFVYLWGLHRVWIGYDVAVLPLADLQSLPILHHAAAS